MIDWEKIRNHPSQDNDYVVLTSDQWEIRIKKNEVKVKEPCAPQKNEVKTGNLYRSKGGKDTRFWYVLAVRKSNGINGDRAILIGLDKTGEIISTNTYGCHAMERRELVANIPLSELTFTDS